MTVGHTGEIGPVYEAAQGIAPCSLNAWIEAAIVAAHTKRLTCAGCGMAVLDAPLL